MQYDSSDFDVAGLYAALDARRSLRGLSWQQVADEINSFFEKVPARPISRSTIVRTREGGIVEGDSVLQMLRWLGRTPESFMPQPLSWATGRQQPPERWPGPDTPLRRPCGVLRYQCTANGAKADVATGRKRNWGS